MTHYLRRTRVTVGVTILAFVLGAIFGGAAVSFLSVRASKTLLRASRSTWLLEETGELRAAWVAGNYPLASRYAACLVDAEENKDSDALAPARSRWGWTYPYVAPMLDAIVLPNITRESRDAEKAETHAQYGVVWEKLGRADLADKEFQEAMRLGGGTDSSKWRDLGLKLLDLGRRHPANGGSPGPNDSTEPKKP